MLLSLSCTNFYIAYKRFEEFALSSLKHGLQLCYVGIKYSQEDLQNIIEEALSQKFETRVKIRAHSNTEDIIKWDEMDFEIYSADIPFPLSIDEEFRDLNENTKLGLLEQYATLLKLHNRNLLDGFQQVKANIPIYYDSWIYSSDDDRLAYKVEDFGLSAEELPKDVLDLLKK